MSTSVSGYYIRLPQRSHSVHHQSCCTVDCDLSSVHFYNVRSPVQWLTVASITGKENTILAFEIDSRFKHCICFHPYDRDNQIANCHFGSNPRILDTCCNAAFRVCQSIVKLPQRCFHAHNQPRWDRSYQSHFGIQHYVNFYKFRWIHSALQYRTPDEVHFGTCKQQAMGDSNSKDFTPIFPWKAVQHRGRCAHRLGCAKTCQQPSSKLCCPLHRKVLPSHDRNNNITQQWLKQFSLWLFPEITLYDHITNLLLY